MNLRVLMLSPYFESHGGGVEAVAGHLARGLTTRFTDLTWMAANIDSVPSAYAGITVRPMSAWNGIERYTGVPLPLWSWAAYRELRVQIGICDVLVVHDTLYIAHLLAIAFARSASKPVLLVQHVGDVPYSNPLAHALVRIGNATATRWAMNSVDRIVFVSRTVRAWFASRSDETIVKSECLPNGVDIRIFGPATESQRTEIRCALGLDQSPVFLFVGRFVQKKGIALLRHLAVHNRDCIFAFAGHGPLDPAAGGHDNVRKLGRLASIELVKWYRAADYLLLPSYGEGFPLVVQEALACGLPAIVGSEIAAAYPELGAGLYGVDVSGTDLDIEPWRQALQRCLDRRCEFPARIGFAAKAATLWSWDSTIDRYATLIHSIAKHAPIT